MKNRPFFGVRTGKMVQLGQRNNVAVAVVETPHGLTRKELAPVLNQHTPTPDNQQEEWRPCPEYEGLYQVSNLGRVRRDPLSRYNWRDKILTLVVRKSGGIEVCLWRDNKGRWLNVARLVASAFVCVPPPGYQVNHKDGNRSNNAVTNLEWLTPSDNIRHAYLNLPHKARKLTADQVRAIRGALATGETRAAIALRYGVSWSAIQRIASGHSWSYLADDEDEA